MRIRSVLPAARQHPTSFHNRPATTALTSCAGEMCRVQSLLTGVNQAAQRTHEGDTLPTLM